MNILIAPNSMKGSLSAFDFADCIEKGFQDVSCDRFDIKKVPLADGGDGTLDVLANAFGLSLQHTEVLNPLGRPVKARYAYNKDVAVIETAEASGLKLLSGEELNPLKTSSFGTGQQIRHAVEQGARHIYVGVGGSATIDGGMGILEALGVSFFDESGKKLSGNGENMGKVAVIDASKLIIGNDIEITVVSDVDNLILGTNGGIQVFGPQKGATPRMITLLEKNIVHYIEVVRQHTGKDASRIKSGGAAGGIPIALYSFLDADIKSGADLILDILNINDLILWADLVITGEGFIDNQTYMNKAPYAVAIRAKKYKKPVIGIAGGISSVENDLFNGVFSITNAPMKLNEAIQNAPRLTYELSRQIAGLICGIRKNRTL